MHPQISSRTTLAVVLYVLVFLTSTGKGQEEAELRYKPRYLLWAFTASGADSNDYDINDYADPSSAHDPEGGRSVIYIRNVKNKKKLWEATVGFTKLMGFGVHEAPDKKHAVLFFTYGVRGRSLYWIHLPDGKPPAKYIDAREFQKRIAKACGDLNADKLNWCLNDFDFSFLDWDAQGRCRLEWEYRIPHEDRDTYNTGIAIVTLGRDGKPSLRVDSFLKDLKIEQMESVRYGKHVTLKK